MYKYLVRSKSKATEYRNNELIDISTPNPR